MASDDQEFRGVDQARLIDDLKKTAENLRVPQIKWATLLLVFVIIPILAYDAYQVRTLNANVSEVIKLQNDQTESFTALLTTEIDNLKKEMATTTEKLQKKLDKLKGLCTVNTK